MDVFWFIFWSGSKSIWHYAKYVFAAQIRSIKPDFLQQVFRTSLMPITGDPVLAYGWGLYSVFVYPDSLKEISITDEKNRVQHYQCKKAWLMLKHYKLRTIKTS